MADQSSGIPQFELGELSRVHHLIGVVSGKALKGARRYVLFGWAIFGAAATPGGDPFSMMALAVPMMLLFLIAEAICHWNDRRRAKSASKELERA